MSTGETGAGAAAPDRDFWHEQRAALADRFAGRDEAVRALQLAVLSGEHAFLFGPPGTAKTSLVRAFAATLQGRLFEQTLSRTRPDAAVLGPLDLPLLRDRGEHRRVVGGYLLDAEWAFLDEIGHISPDLGHDLHAALSDRVRHEVAGGRCTHPIPLRSAFTAGNTIPGDGGTGEPDDDARALWDRLLVRVPVGYLSRADAARMLTACPDTGALPWRPLTGLDADRAAVDAVTVPGAVCEELLGLRDRLTAAGDVFSDRRWHASLRLVRATAWLRGAAEAGAADLAALRFALWDHSEQRDRVLREIAQVSDPLEAERLDLLAMVRLLTEVSGSYRDRPSTARTPWLREARRKHRALRERTEALRRRWGTRDDAALTEIVDALRDGADAIAGLDEPAPAAGRSR
ncbi:AAA family ATPase [Pseudonocardia phyllosphaerae]|uniref:AAA family ATPase n=1 Tax=Pseudonocardia phyllosphaerae TaxID=3390502 RepID=UPI00397C080E